MFVCIVVLLVMVFTLYWYQRRKRMRQITGFPIRVKNPPASSAPLAHVQSLPDNPYGNPLPYSGVEPKAKPAIKPTSDGFTELDRVARGTTEADPGWFFNTVPDPTLVARPVFWNQDPQPDIVSQEDLLGWRLGR